MIEIVMLQLLLTIEQSVQNELMVFETLQNLLCMISISNQI